MTREIDSPTQEESISWLNQPIDPVRDFMAYVFGCMDSQVVKWHKEGTYGTALGKKMEEALQEVYRKIAIQSWSER